MVWNPFKRDAGDLVPRAINPPQAALPPMDDDNFAATSHAMATQSTSKSFDWMHYEAITGGVSANLFASEFALLPTVRIMKAMHIQEPWVNACTSAIAKQFLGAKMILKKKKTKDGQATIIASHPILDFLRFASKEIENPSFFMMNTITDGILTGNSYIWHSDDFSEKRRLPAEHVDVVVRDNRVQSYRIMDRSYVADGISGTNAAARGKPILEIPPENMIHFKLPNPFTAHVGMSMFIAVVLPVLIEKYGREYVVGFFLRGGQTAGIIETKTQNGEQLMRLARTIMQAFGGRKNMHADKILPDGATWKGQGSSFGEIRLIELLKDNVGHFRAATGCTNTVLGIVENVNRATAFAEMELFWLSTVLPLQKLFCACVESSQAWDAFKLDSSYELAFDNSEVVYLDDFDRRLDQDVKLAGTWTIDERRQRLGKDPLEDGSGGVLAAKAPPAQPPPDQGGADQGKAAPGKSKAAPADADAEWKAAEDRRMDPSPAVMALFQREFASWIEIIVASLDDEAAALEVIQGHADAFAHDFRDATIDTVMHAYDAQMHRILRQARAAGQFATKESEQDRAAKLDMLKERARQVLEEGIFDNGRSSFVGYSKTATANMYDFIAEKLDEGMSMADVASSVRTEFNAAYGQEEAYTGQAETIVRTEWGAAVSLGQKQFGDDLAAATKAMSKNWITMGDNHVRDSHASLPSENPLSGSSTEVMDMRWSNGLRYPRDPDGAAAEVINCRCSIQFSVDDWGD